jgi:hypothetical protein
LQTSHNQNSLELPPDRICEYVRVEPSPPGHRLHSTPPNEFERSLLARTGRNGRPVSACINSYCEFARQRPKLSPSSLCISDSGMLQLFHGTSIRKDCHWTVSIKLTDWLIDPEVALTVSVYVPAGVPFGSEEIPPPPQEQSKAANEITKANRSRLCLL